MKVTKYRAWDKIRKRMVLNPQMDYCDLSVGYGFTNMYDEQERQVEDFDLMLFTGLKDKKGKEICEGDLVKCKIGHSGKFLCKITWNNGGFFFEPIRGIYGQKFVIWEYIITPEVIGNIYKNPELLETEDNCELEQCAYCYCMKPKRGFKTVRIRKWKNEKTKGIRRICKRCQISLKGEYTRTVTVIVKNKTEFLKAVKECPEGATIVWKDQKKEVWDEIDWKLYRQIVIFSKVIRGEPITKKEEKAFGQARNAEEDMMKTTLAAQLKNPSKRITFSCKDFMKLIEGKGQHSSLGKKKRKRVKK